MLRTSSSTDSLISTSQIAVKYNEIDGDGKLIKKLSKSRKIIKSLKISKAWKVVKAIGLEKHLPKY